MPRILTQHSLKIHCSTVAPSTIRKFHMKKSHITRILSAAIKYESIGFIPAGTKLTPGSKKHLSDSQIIVTSGALVNYDRVYIVSLSKTMHILEIFC